MEEIRSRGQHEFAVPEEECAGARRVVIRALDGLGQWPKRSVAEIEARSKVSEAEQESTHNEHESARTAPQAKNGPGRRASPKAMTASQITSELAVDGSKSRSRRKISQNQKSAK
jgi:hypothetical protein